ncbi:uncharacterized protein [Miscanthus floridulus]|uniref:uncharacterized protein n=1 Tax=Miscanthus floridulus TaxID=154761 RepID=UPI003459EFE9
MVPMVPDVHHHQPRRSTPITSLIWGATRSWSAHSWVPHLTKVLMDRGSGLNILYANTLDKMGIPWSSLRLSWAPFYGIMSGKEAMTLGCIWFNITFGQPDNFCKELLTFEVVDFPDIYHALLGRPCFTKFMAIPNYTYLNLKMPILKGVITIMGSFEQAYYCE